MDPVIGATVRHPNGHIGVELLRVGNAGNGDVLLDVDGLEVVVDRGELLDALNAQERDVYEEAA